eukprot:8462709-Alexandrium_andersonii.AAC.1
MSGAPSPVCDHRSAVLWNAGALKTTLGSSGKLPESRLECYRKLLGSLRRASRETPTRSGKFRRALKGSGEF